MQLNPFRNSIQEQLTVSIFDSSSPYAKTTRNSQKPGDRRNMTLYGSFNFSKKEKVEKEKPSVASRHGCRLIEDLYMFDESPLNCRVKTRKKSQFAYAS